MNHTQMDIIESVKLISDEYIQRNLRQRERVKNLLSNYFDSNILVENEGILERIMHPPKNYFRYMDAVKADLFIGNYHPWLTHPLVYEDQYDGKWYSVNISSENTAEEKEILNHYKKLLECSETDEDIPTHTRGFLKLGSFTTTPFSEKMWMEYANNSEGICVEYDINWDLQNCLNKLDSLYCRLYPMIYTKIPVDLSEIILDMVDELTFGYLVSILKSEKYRYEDEWRAIVFEPIYGNPHLGYTGFCSIDDVDNLGKMDDETHAETQKEIENGTFISGFNYNHDQLPKNIYLGKNISSDLKDKLCSFAKTYNITLYNIVEGDNGLSAEMFVD